jgi:hypothetical protein
MSAEWGTLEEVIQQMLEARFREYEEAIERDLIEGAGIGEPVGIVNEAVFAQEREGRWRPPAGWREHVAGEVLTGEVLEQDGDRWRTVNMGGFSVTDNRKVRFTRLESEAQKLFRIPSPGS